MLCLALHHHEIRSYFFRTDGRFRCVFSRGCASKASNCDVFPNTEVELSVSEVRLYPLSGKGIVIEHRVLHQAELELFSIPGRGRSFVDDVGGMASSYWPAHAGTKFQLDMLPSRLVVVR